MGTLSRRAFLISGGILGGGLVLGYFATPNRLAIRAGAPFLATWVRIGPDNSVTVLVPHAEMGQGTHTALPMMLAEELDVDWSLVRVEQAPAEEAYAAGDVVRGHVLGDRDVPRPLLRHADYVSYRIARLMNLQITEGSSSVRFTGQLGMRRAGAAARQLLIQAAAARWGVPESQCETRLSHVYHRPSGRSASYGEMAEAAARGRLPEHPVFKPRSNRRICGRPMARLDLPVHVSGAAIYGIDVRLPGLKYAAVRHAPVFGGDAVSFDPTFLTGTSGEFRIVKLPGAVAAVADSFWQAKKAIDNLPVEFDEGPNRDFNSEGLARQFDHLLSQGQPRVDRRIGRSEEVIATAHDIIEAVYEVPFLAHAAMEPMNCTAWFRDGRLELWTGTQDLLGVRAAAATTARMSMDAVTAHPVPVGGSFGRRLPGAFNYVEEVVRIALQIPHPVQLIWTREEDLQHDFYRPAGKSRFRAAIGPGGRPEAWDNVYTDIGFNENRGAAFPAYDIPNQRIGRVEHDTPVPLGFWRGVEHSYQGFFIESFVDEMAHRVAMDPLAFRVKLLRSRPRHRAVLLAAADLLGWRGRDAGPGWGHGIAVTECFGTIIAEAVEVNVTADGVLRVARVTAAADPGEVVNPDIAAAQIEGGIIFALSAALYGRISIEQGRVVQGNFSNYEMIRLAEAPEIAVQFIESGASIGGLGEVGVPPLAAALANAVFAATGRRLRRLPLFGTDRRLAS